MATNPLPLILLAGGAALLLGSKKKSGSSGGGSANGPKSPNGGNGKPASDSPGDTKWNRIRLDKSSARNAADMKAIGMERPSGLPIEDSTPLSIISIGEGDELEIVYTEHLPESNTTDLEKLNVMTMARPGEGPETLEGASIVSEVSRDVIKKPFKEAGEGKTVSVILRPTGLRGEALLSVMHRRRNKYEFFDRDWREWAVLVKKGV